MNRRFKGIWIPAAIWLSTDLRVGEKIMLVEIESLEDEKRGCYASNAHFAEFFGLSISRVSEVISQLEQKGFITIDQKRDGLRVVERQIRLTKSFDDLQTSSEKAMNPFGKGDEPPSEKAKGSNTKILSNTVKEKTSCHQQADDVPFEAIVETYNRVCGKVFKGALALTPKRKANIKTLVNLKIGKGRPFKDKGIPFWEAYFTDCLTNPHWRGQNDRGWKADLEFLTRPEVATKMIEGIAQ